MKRILTALFFSFSLSCSSQTIIDMVLEAGNHYLKEEYTKAIPLAEKAVDEVTNLVGTDNEIYIGLLTILASSYKFTFQYEKSERIYLDLNARVLKFSGENSEAYSSYLNNFAGLYEKMGQFHKAEPLFLKGMELRKKNVGEYDEAYSTCLNGLAALYHSMGQYSKSEPLYIKVNEIRKKIYGEEHTNYAVSLNNLATLYMETGQYEKAEPLYIKANAIQKRLLGENNAVYAMGLNNIANLWHQLKLYNKAEAAYLESAEIRKRTLGPTHADYAASLNNVATLYAEQAQYKKAETYLTDAIRIWKISAGETSAAYATGLNNLAALYRKTQTQYPKAEQLYLEALRLRKAILGESHPFYADTQNDLALLYIHMKEYKKAEPLFLSSSEILLKNIASIFTILSEKEKANYLDYNRSFIESNNSYLYHYPQAPASVLENNYNLELGFKSLSLADTRNMLDLVRNSQDSVVRRIFEKWVTVKNLLAKQYAIPAAFRMDNLKGKETEAELLEKELNRRSAAFSTQQQSLRITMKDVQQQLAEDEAAVEFVRFRLYNKKQTDSFMYAAYVVRKHDVSPRFVVLCEEKQLQRIFDSAGSNPNRLVKSLYRGLGATEQELKLGVKLYQLVWTPLEPLLAGVKKVSYSPAGSLYGVAFHALTVDPQLILMDKYQLNQYTSTRQIALRKRNIETKSPKNITLFGDPLFTMDSAQLVQLRKMNDTTASISLIASRGNGMGMWSGLPGTAEEVKAIRTLFETNKIATRSFVGVAASEENFKRLNGKGPEILHIATHGFFLPQPEHNTDDMGNVYSLANDPLIRSGLVFAGGNYVWSGRAPLEGIEDGVATAYEISQLNLGSTGIVVLSACETALGDIKGTEGVFGLQRAFKIAGVKKLIVSLWQVPDKETAELMILFYSNWMAGKTIDDSFFQAQSAMRKKYPAYYWAAFVLLD